MRLGHLLAGGAVIALAGCAPCATAPSAPADRPQPLPTLGVGLPTSDEGLRREGTSTISGVADPTLALPSGMGVAYVTLLPGHGDLIWAIWVLSDTAEPRLLVEGPKVGGPRISPDRQWVAYFRDRDLRAVRWDGREDKLLVKVDSLPDDDLPPAPAATGYVSRTICDLAWSLDSTRLVFNTWRQGVDLTEAESVWLEDADDLWQVSVGSGEVRQLLPPGQGGYFALSPDGQWIALTATGCRRDATGGAIALARADGTARRTVLANVAFGDPWVWAGRPGAVPHWMPDSQALLVAFPVQAPDGTPEEGEAGGEIGLYRLPVDGDLEEVGRVRSWIYHGNPWDNKHVVAAGDAAWSPDLAKLALVQRIDAAAAAHASQGSVDRPSATAPPGDGTATPTARELCRPREALSVARGDGSGAEEYARAGWVRFLGWSTDGGRFAYDSGYPDAPGAVCTDAGPALVSVGQVGQPPLPLGTAVDIEQLQWIGPDRLLLYTAAHAGWRLEMWTADGRIRELASGVQGWDSGRHDAPRRSN